MHLHKYEEISGVIHCLSGVRIGGNNNVIEIGVIDNPIIRNPITNYPYLPGSSLKGKMRSALELTLRKGALPEIGLPLPTIKPATDRQGNTILDRDRKKEIPPCACGKCVVCKLFGSSETKTNLEPTRLLFRDCQLTDESLQVLSIAAKERGIFFAEIKPGIRMNRATNSVSRGAFFNFERVPEGTEFVFELTLRIYGELDTDTAEKDYRKIVARGLQLLEKEGLGGKISSGFGRIEFRQMKWGDKEFDFKKEA